MKKDPKQQFSAEQEKNKFEQDPSLLRPGERYCSKCQKIIPRFCQGHKDNAGGNDSGGSSDYTQDSKKGNADQNYTSDDKKARTLKHLAPYVRLYQSSHMPQLFSIALVPQKGISLSEDELHQWKLILSSLPDLFEAFKKALKALEHDKGPSGKNFHGYWSKVVGNEFQFQIPDAKDRADFLTILQDRLRKDFPQLKLVPMLRSADLDEEQKHQAGIGLFPKSPFELEFVRQK